MASVTPSFLLIDLSFMNEYDVERDFNFVAAKHPVSLSRTHGGGGGGIDSQLGVKKNSVLAFRTFSGVFRRFWSFWVFLANVSVSQSSSNASSPEEVNSRSTSKVR